MKTTIDLPADLLEQTKIAAARKRSSIKKLVIDGLKMVLNEDQHLANPPAALTRLRQGYHLGGQPLPRAQSHAR